LKLNNILVGKGNPGIEVYLSDFGLSKVIGAGPVVSRCFNAMAEALGVEFSAEEKYTPTPIETHKLSKLNLSFLQAYAFLAPEQKRLEEIGVAADVYAFGVLTYYLITGLFPEGVMDISSRIPVDYKCDWNRLISQCMNPFPEKRPQILTPILEVLSKGSVSLPETFTTPPLKAVVEPDPELAPLPKPPIPEEIKEKVEEKVLEPVLVQVTEPVSVETAIPEPITPSKDEKYERALSSMLNREPVVTQYQPEQKEKRTIEPIHTETAVVPGGGFTRGSNNGNRDEMPQHQVNLASYAIDVHPITNEQFSRFLEHMGGEKDQNYNDLIRVKDSRINRVTGRLSIESGYAKHPVVGVTWYGAVGYAKWVGKRLPTEAEWEISVRGGQENTCYPTGDTIEKNQANFFSADTTAVKSYAPNAYGIYDMIGNVYEWCQDWYGYNYYESSAQEPDKPKGPIQGVYRVLRGGCWKSLKEDMRCSHRHRNNPGTVNGTYGFRCASDID
nr:Serine/threonine-protein kinase pkn1 [Chlamydiota bacterium]